MFDDRNPAASAEESIVIHGAREHNLKNLSLSLPRNKFVVVTGVSGSGKSTLAFDLLFAEGQRRFLDSMNIYARQFVEQLSRPDVDLITGIPPTVSIEQRTSRGVRLLFARLGTQYCPDCQIPVETQTRDELGRRLQREIARRGALTLLAPVVKNRKGFHTDVAEWAASHGYSQVRADGRMYDSGERLRLDRFREHDVEIVTGELTKNSGKKAEKSPQQLIDETLKLGGGMLLALDRRGQTSIHSTERACPKCHRSFEALDPKNFSYNSPQGWCPQCRGFGETFYLPDVERGARADAIEESWYGWQEGNRELCSACNGARLNPVARAVHLETGARQPDLTVDLFSQLSVEAAHDFFRGIKYQGRSAEIARDILPEIHERLKFLGEVGLGYLQLGRGVPTLSGGESQRIRLAAQLGSNLSGVLYILDEPTIGLHARDNEQLLTALEKLKSRGNSVLVVEHDEATMLRADYIIDLGPAAGVHGGEVIAAGTLADLRRHPNSITGKWLREKKVFPSRGSRRPVNDKDVAWLDLRHARRNNLKDVSVRFPLGRLVLVTGVSGSGKSSLIRECLLPALKAKVVPRGATKPSSRSTDVDRQTTIAGFNSLQAVYEVDQSPIGRTPRSIPATYVGFFDDIRQLFAQVPEARLRGYSPSRFSFNSAQGRCPQCEGAGTIKLEMNFLPPAFVRCEVCHGTRFNRETLDIEYGGKNVAQILELSVEEALEFFGAMQRIRRPLQALCDTGLGYLKLGQPSACTWPTCDGSWKCCSDSWKRGTRWWSSNTIWI